MPIIKETRMGNNPPTREILPPGARFNVTEVSRTRVIKGRGSVLADGVIIGESGACGLMARKFEKVVVNARNIRNEIKQMTLLGRILRLGRSETIIWVPESTTQS